MSLAKVENLRYKHAWVSRSINKRIRHLLNSVHRPAFIGFVDEWNISNIQ